ncbi:MAG: response regulator transcription factor [Faecalicatena sp.]|uniref:response regulator transcription factor n=1 Tax=Faecalicatena sp. TaxID=2005360 RepID=UPI00258C606B|nr:response regulator transcription factor [Faecalicatena sp.]MCI6468051.1 response regulator transcription factor [Faecalicatena sp.]MDY5618529.1 response regulator transcription factor [Lachnospiraceae bacterium]
MKDILLVEDNRELAELLQTFLEKDGFTVYSVPTGEEAQAYLKENSVKIMLLDIMLPGMDGFAVCRAVREKGDIPILIMSARAEKDDKLNGFGLGADDYMEKPVDPDLLSAKVRALLQRTYGARSETDCLVSGGLTIDRKARKVYRDHQAVELNVKEYELLLLLAENPGRTLHKEYLFDRIWGMESFSENQTLTVHIRMLRNKIEENPRAPRRIQTVWGVGYRYEEI